MRRAPQRVLLAGFFAALAALLPAAAAQPSTPPDINTPFLVNPDVERWKNNLENEGREVYAKRNQILAATGVKPAMVVADVGAGTGLLTQAAAWWWSISSASPA
jgi:predicted methyltransferase